MQQRCDCTLYASQYRKYTFTRVNISAIDELFCGTLARGAGRYAFVCFLLSRRIDVSEFWIFFFFCILIAPRRGRQQRSPDDPIYFYARSTQKCEERESTFWKESREDPRRICYKTKCCQNFVHNVD